MSGPISTNLISFGSIKDDTMWGAFASMKLWSNRYASGSEFSKMIKVASCGSLDEFGRRMVKSTLEMVGSKSNLNQQIEWDGKSVGYKSMINCMEILIHIHIFASTASHMVL
jgi:hypothetical protein